MTERRYGFVTPVLRWGVFAWPAILGSSLVYVWVRFAVIAGWSLAGVSPGSTPAAPKLVRTQEATAMEPLQPRPWL
jgi:hypothetical protein